MANSVDPVQTAPIGAVCSGSMLFASIFNSPVNVRQLFAADDFSRQHFQMHFFLGALRVKLLMRLTPSKMGLVAKTPDFLACLHQKRR